MAAAERGDFGGEKTAYWRSERGQGDQEEKSDNHKKRELKRTKGTEHTGET